MRTFVTQRPETDNVKFKSAEELHSSFLISHHFIKLSLPVGTGLAPCKINLWLIEIMVISILFFVSSVYSIYKVSKKKILVVKKTSKGFALPK